MKTLIGIFISVLFISSCEHVGVVTEVDPGIDEFIAVDVNPVPIKKVDPVYPDEARRSGVEGKVFVKVLVDKEGKVKRAVVMTGPDIFHEATIAAVMQWVFKPAMLHGKPIAVWVALPFQFKLRSDSRRSNVF